jgi:hypothetical protein
MGTASSLRSPPCLRRSSPSLAPCWAPRSRLLALAACSSGPNDEDGAGVASDAIVGTIAADSPALDAVGQVYGPNVFAPGQPMLPYGSATLIAPDRLLVAIGSLAPGAEFRVGPNPASPSQTIPIVRWIRIVQSDVDTVSLRGLPGPQGAMVAYLARPVVGVTPLPIGDLSRADIGGAYQRRRLWERGGRAAARPNDSSGHARRFGATHPLPRRRRVRRRPEGHVDGQLPPGDDPRIREPRLERAARQRRRGDRRRHRRHGPLPSAPGTWAPPWSDGSGGDRTWSGSYRSTSVSQHRRTWSYPVGYFDSAPRPRSSSPPRPGPHARVSRIGATGADVSTRPRPC